MSFLSPTFMFLFLPLALIAFAVVPKQKRIDILPVIGIVFFVCVNISDPLSLLYITFVAASVIAAMAIYKKTRKALYLHLFAIIFFALGAVILVLRIFNGASLLRGAGVVICLMSSVSLCLDVARGKENAPRSLWEGVAYVTYFPTMLVGPFLSFKEFTERSKSGLGFSTESFAKGTLLFLKGFIKAIYIGAILGDAFTGVLSFGSDSMGSAVAILVIAAQSLALYAFFSGYSDMARGISALLGIEIEPDMGSPFDSLTPSEYLRSFFRGFSVFFKSYIAAPVISAFGETVWSRILASALSSTMLLLLFCQNPQTFLILLPFTVIAEYFVLFGRSPKKLPAIPARIAKCLLTFAIMAAAWAVVSSSSIDEMKDSFAQTASNGFFYISYSGAAKLLNLKYLVLPTVGCIMSFAGSFVLKSNDTAGEKTGFTIFKYAASIVLLLAFTMGVIMLLPQFPGLASAVFGANII